MARSQRTRKSERAGRTPTNPETRLRELLDRVWRAELRVKADYARANAEIVAMAASLQLISTKTDSNTFAAAWLITPKGLTWLNQGAT